MAVIGTFGSFTTARLGIYASQASLQVTGNNIANINTKGYTRQRADLFSLNSTGTAKYANPLGVDVGYGVLVNQVTQLRDPYLDIRYRNENTKLGYYNTTLAGLNKLSQTLDEVNKGGESKNGIIEDYLQTFKSMLEELAAHVGSEEYDGLVRESAKSLTTFFNTAAKDLQTDWDLQKDELNDTVKEVNKCLTNIRDLNEQIRKQGIYGDNALELRDHRNLYIDELSEYLNINVEYSMERIDQYTEIEKLTITLKDTKDPRTGNPIKLIDGLFGGQLSLSEYEINPKYNPNASAAELAKDPGLGKKYLDKNGEPTNDIDSDPPKDTDAAKVDPNKFLFQVERLEDKFGRPLDKGLNNADDKKYESVAVPLGDNDLNGSLQAMRELLTEEGEFASMSDVGKDAAGKELNPNVAANYSTLRGMDANASIKKGIPYYQKRLDLLAQKFASVFNEANQMAASTVYQVDGLVAGAKPTDGQFFLNEDGKTDFNFPDGTTKTIAVGDVTIEITDDAGVGTGERVPLDTVAGRKELKKKYPAETEEQINKRISDASEALEVLRNQAKPAAGYEFYDGGVLFSNSGNNNDPSGITAMNISIANSWAARTVRVLNTKRPDTPDDPDTPDVDESIAHTSRNDNIDHMITLFEQQLDYSAMELEPNAAGGNKTFLHGSFQEIYTDIGATLGSETQTIMGVTANYELMTLDLDNDRSSVSGVDLNEEATGMMQYQKSYQAACRLLTTIDSMLDTLINNTLR